VSNCGLIAATRPMTRRAQLRTHAPLHKVRGMALSQLIALGFSRFLINLSEQLGVQLDDSGAKMFSKRSNTSVSIHTFRRSSFELGDGGVGQGWVAVQVVSVED